MGSRTHIAVPEAGDEELSVDERLALIERVASSSHFKRSARLRDFLLYVGTQSLKEGCAEIHEQEIGANVFGRSLSYDRSQDNIVRVNATELRKRIELYFAEEGADETLLLEIPRGSYKPVFRRRVPVLQGLPTLAGDVGTLEMERVLPKIARAVDLEPRRPGSLWWEVLCGVLAICCLVLWQQNRTMRKALNVWDGRPAVEAFWGDFFQQHQLTDIVLADASVSLSEEMFQHPISLTDYLNHQYLSSSDASHMSPDSKVDLERLFGHNLVAFGDFRAAQQILALDPGSSLLRLSYARFYQADQIKRDNLILIGGKKANPWIRLFDDQVNFSLDFDTQRGKTIVANRHPQPGEQAVYVPEGDPNPLEGYSVIAFLPNPSRTGNVVILAGTGSDATNAAAEFLTSEEQLEKFAKKLGVKRFPYFEVVLKTSHLSGTAFNAELLAYRTYPKVQ